MRQKLDIIGQTFGRLFVLQEAGKNKYGLYLYQCRCNCGNICIITGTKIKSGKKKSCGCLLQETRAKGPISRIHMIGKKIEKLTIVSQAPNRKKIIMYNCDCECGNKIIVSGSNLRQKLTKSCGCYFTECISNRNKNKRSLDPWHRDMYIYKQNASKRGLCFLISREEFISLVTSLCHYCGAPPDSQCGSAELKEKGVLRNGIDKKDYSIGYILENCVSCCWMCNMNKSTQTYDQFIEITKKRYNHLKSIGLIS